MVKDNPKRFPDFFSVYLPAFSSEKLLIPQSFMDCLNGAMPENTILRNKMGEEWHVEVEKTEQRTFFRRGWKRFIEENSIQEGEFLVFRYNGYLFDCRVFGHSMCEKINPPSREKGKEHAEVKEEEHEGDDSDTEEDDDDEGEEGDDDDDIGDVLFEGEGEEEEDDDDDEGEEEGDNDDDIGDVLFEGEGEEEEDDDDEGEGEGDDDDDDDDIRDVLFKCPSFIALYRPGPRLQLRVPAKVIKDNNLVLAKNMVYHDPYNREWEGKVSVWSDGSTWIGGWELFCQKNNVRIGDQCICELVLDKGSHRCSGFRCSHRCSKIKVQIIRGGQAT